MKNPTILKDELGLLRADRSAVLAELRKIGDELKDIYILKSSTESELAEVRNTILEETARLDDIRGRAVLVKTELAQCTQELKNTNNSLETSRVKNSQAIKLHLGRIKELEERREETLNKISELKNTYDRNSAVYLQNEIERKTKIRALESEIAFRAKELNSVTDKLEKDLEADKKITKERLKREDKLRVRERHVEAKEKSLLKKEEDLMTMSVDLAIVYSRLKELYAKVDPGVDLDKLIMKAI